MDAYELLRSPEDPKKESGWKTFHINKIEGLRLLTTQEIEKVFPILRDDPVLAAPSEIPE